MNRERLSGTVVKNLKKQGAKKVTVFGSYSRKQQNKGSDLDLIVKFRSRKSFLDLVRIERELNEKSGVKIDLLTKDSISPRIMDYVKKDMEVIYS